MTSLFRAAALATLLCCTPSLASAQTARPALPDIEVGSRIWVANSKGLELHGDLVNISAETIEINTAAGPRRIAISDVWTIMQKDSNRNGFLMGAGFGLLAGVSFGSVTRPGVSQGSRTGYYIGTTIISALMYGGIGAWVDSAIEGRDLIYRRASDEDHPALALALSPVASLTPGARRIGVAGAVTWR